MARLDERGAHTRTLAFNASVLSGKADLVAAAAANEAARAFVKADQAAVEVEAAKKATHTIQMVPVDDVADKSLNLNMEGLDDLSAATFSDLERATAGMENLL